MREKTIFLNSIHEFIKDLVEESFIIQGVDGEFEDTLVIGHETNREITLTLLPFDKEEFPGIKFFQFQSSVLFTNEIKNDLSKQINIINSEILLGKYILFNESTIYYNYIHTMYSSQKIENEGFKSLLLSIISLVNTYHHLVEKLIKEN